MVHVRSPATPTRRRAAHKGGDARVAIKRRVTPAAADAVARDRDPQALPRSHTPSPARATSAAGFAQTALRTMSLLGPSVAGVVLGTMALASPAQAAQDLPQPSARDDDASRALAAAILFDAAATVVSSPSHAPPVTPLSKSAKMAATDLARVTAHKDGIIKAARKHGLSPSVLAGMISRESRGRNIIGDSGHGHGLTQIDDRSYADWTADWIAKGKSAQGSIDQGAKILAARIDYFNKKFPKLDDDAILRAALAGYNAGDGTVARALHRGRTADSVTTGKDYSKDILARADYYRTHGFAD